MTPSTEIVNPMPPRVGRLTLGWGQNRHIVFFYCLANTEKKLPAHLE